MKTFLAGLTFTLIAVGVAFSATITVTSHSDSGPGSLRDAIANAASGDTITFALPAPDTITLDTAGLTINRDLTITGPGSDLLTIARSTASGTPAFAVFDILDGAATISGLTISHGDGGTQPYGGGMYVHSFATVDISGCNFTDNVGGMGGGFATDGNGSAFITSCTFTGNSAKLSGGAVFASGINTVISRCVISNNSATFAGGGIAAYGFIQISRTTISGNTIPASPDSGTADGAGIYNVGYVTMNNCTVANNDNGRGNGGGASNEGAQFDATNCTFYGNTAQGDGGAIANGGPASLTDCTVTNNTASENSPYDSDLGGGGIDNVAGPVTLKNTIVAANHSPIHPDVASSSTFPGFLSEGYNLIGNGTGSDITPATGDQIGAFNSPIDPMLAPLADNGGSTQTCALLPGSPAINVGDPDAPTTDQRFYYRTDTPDIGAYELGATIPITLANISTRLLVETGDNVLIGGFIVTGTHSKAVLLRAVGPSLQLDGALADPILELHDGSGATIATNDNWQTNDNKQEIIDAGLAPANPKESALLLTLDPGAYTAILSGVSDSTGIGLVEAYDLDQTSDAILANISTRGFVQTGDNVIIGGFIVAGNGNVSETVLIRGVGPSLPIPGALADPTLELHDGNGEIVLSNDNWRDSQEADIEATGIPPANDAESAILAELAPGGYTAILRGAQDTTGVALVEVYNLD